jgi:hypothetical protein
MMSVGTKVTFAKIVRVLLTVTIGCLQMKRPGLEDPIISTLDLHCG